MVSIFYFSKPIAFNTSTETDFTQKFTNVREFDDSQPGCFLCSPLAFFGVFQGQPPCSDDYQALRGDEILPTLRICSGRIWDLG